MVDVTIQGTQLEVEVKGLHKLLALKGRVSVPLSKVRGARPDPFAASSFWKGLRMPGTHIPGLIAAGTFYHQNQKTFWDVSRPEKALVIELEGAGYDRLVVEVADPVRTATLIEEAIATS